MLETEHIFQPDWQYMKLRTHINENSRAILINSLVEMHRKFRLLPETLFLVVNLIDRYLSKHDLYQQEMTLLGLATMLIATKYEEIYPPQINDFKHRARSNIPKE